MKYLHTMVRVTDIDASLDFYCNLLGLVELRRKESEQGRFTLVFLAAPGDEDAQHLPCGERPQVRPAGDGDAREAELADVLLVGPCGDCLLYTSPSPRDHG